MNAIPTIEFVAFCLQQSPGAGVVTLRAVLARMAREGLAPETFLKLDDRALQSRFGLKSPAVAALRQPDADTIETWNQLLLRGVFRTIGNSGGQPLLSPTWSLQLETLTQWPTEPGQAHFRSAQRRRCYSSYARSEGTASPRRIQALASCNCFMAQAHPKRPIEVDLPMKRISAPAGRENSIRHGHILTPHIRWTRRPLATCRAVNIHVERLRKDYWLYVVFHCATQKPSLNILRDPSTLHWQPIVKVEHYRLNQDSVKHPVELKEDAPSYLTGEEK